MTSFRILVASTILLTGTALPHGASAQALPGEPVPVPPGSIGTQAPVARPLTDFAQTSPAAQASPAANAETNIRIDRLEGELRALTGQMEQLMFQMRQLQDELLRAREDTEFRLRELETVGVSGQRAVQPGEPSIGEPNVTDETLRAALTATQQGQPPQDLGTLTVDANGEAVPTTDAGIPLDLSRLTLNAAPDVRPQAPLGAALASADPVAELAPGDVYDVGYNHVLRGDYGQAVTIFGDFLDRYPDDRLRPNAHFWLGESHFAMGAYTPAAEHFLAVFNEHPEDVKVPDALLKLAMSLERLGAQSQACATFEKLLVDYPRAPQIVLDTARGEHGRAGC
ncbi:MAG: tol-pal system protein YbgF [Pseudomonadota bacterium]